MMALGIILFVVLAVLAFLLFYLMIRIKDISAGLRDISCKFPLTDEMRKQASGTIESLNERMGSLNQKAMQINDVMNEVTSLRNMFIMPKGAGSIGERLLEKALHDVLPDNMLETQVRLSSGTVDFTIKFKEYIVPIDSKLSLEDFNKMLSASDDEQKRAHWKAFSSAVKERIDETAKYILPNEKTTDFALMYIASEGVYYEAFVKSEQFGENNTLIEYALKKKVYPTSPQTIYPYLMTILQGMKALKIEENAKNILKSLSALDIEINRFKEDFNTLGSHLSNANTKYTDSQRRLDKVTDKLTNIQDTKKIEAK